MSSRLIERLQSLYPEASRRSLKQWLTGSRVRVNDAVVVRGDVEVEAADRIELTSPAPPACPAPLRLVHEDDDILGGDKPPGLLTIPPQSEPRRPASPPLRRVAPRRAPPRA